MSFNLIFSLFSLLVSLVVFSYFYQETLLSFKEIWDISDTFAHGYLILPISFYLMWTKRAELFSYKPKPSFAGLIFVVASVALWTFAKLVDVRVAMQFSVVFMVIGLVWTILGNKMTWSIAFPLAYLIFAVPAGEFLTQPLMDYTAQFTVYAIKLTGIPVYLDGRFISIPSGNWEVAEACSGIRYLIASIALGSLYAYVSYQSYLRRAAFILLAIATPIVANWLRAFGIVMLGHFSGNTLATGVDHIIYGWMFFGVVMLVMFWVGSFWFEKSDIEDLSTDKNKIFSEQPEIKISVVSILIMSILGTGIAISGNTLYQSINSGAVIDNSSYSITFPDNAGVWTMQPITNDEWIPDYNGADSYKHARYISDTGAEIEVYQVVYFNEQQGKELVSYENHIHDMSKWQLQGRKTFTYTNNNNESISVKEDMLSFKGKKYLLWQRYDIAGYMTQSDTLGKLYGAVSKLLRNTDGNGVTAIMIQYDERIDSARALMISLDNEEKVLSHSLLSR